MNLACQQYRYTSSILHIDDERKLIQNKLYDLIRIKHLIDKLFACDDITTYILSFETGYFASFKNQIIMNYTVLNERANKYTDSLYQEWQITDRNCCCYIKYINRYKLRVEREYAHPACRGCPCCTDDLMGNEVTDDETDYETDETYDDSLYGDDVDYD